MADPLKLHGPIVTSYFAAIDLAAGAAKCLVYRFDQRPPVTESDWTEFFRLTLRLAKELDGIQRNAKEGLDAARANKIISQTADPLAAIDELIGRLQTMKEAYRQS